MLPLLTTAEAAAQLKMGRKEFSALGIPFVLLGKRKKRYRQEDIDSFVNTRLRYPQALEASIAAARRVRRTRLVEVGVPYKSPIWKEIKTLRGRGPYTQSE